MSSSTDTNNVDNGTHVRTHCCFKGGGGNWSGLNIAAMVFGFILFWPIGLFILFWIITGRSVQELYRWTRRQWGKLTENWNDGDGFAPTGRTDNVVFNEYQQTQHDRIREIKDEIKERASRFASYRADAKRRADEEEFNRFMSDSPIRGDS